VIDVVPIVMPFDMAPEDIVPGVCSASSDAEPLLDNSRLAADGADFMSLAAGAVFAVLLAGVAVGDFVACEPTPPPDGVT
jgi:hypothetical protein